MQQTRTATQRNGPDHLGIARSTVTGAFPPRGQELCDHYMAPMNQHALDCMNEMQATPPPNPAVLCATAFPCRLCFALPPFPASHRPSKAFTQRDTAPFGCALRCRLYFALRQCLSLRPSLAALPLASFPHCLSPLRQRLSSRPPTTHGLPSNKMARITSDCGTTRPPSAHQTALTTSDSPRQEECYMLGIPLRTRHREVAPNQYGALPSETVRAVLRTPL